MQPPDTSASPLPISGQAGLAGDSSRLTLISRTPLNAETRLDAHLGLITPVSAFYTRNHFPLPTLSLDEWRLALGGLVERPAVFTYEALRALPSRTLLVTIECAGNGRAGLQPAVPGEPWGYGAVSTGEWTGVPLTHLLEVAGLSPAARELVITGADAGHVSEAGGTLAYARSLPIAHARQPDVLLAYAMNGEPLSPTHGFPLRLVVPGWYGMAAVKWITRIDAVAAPFRGFYQVARYVLPPPYPAPAPAPDPDSARGEPVPLTTMAVRSLISSPADGASLPAGRYSIRGYAWSGAAPVAQVEVSLDGGRTWQRAEWTSEPSRYAWRLWELAWHADTAGPVIMASRATDNVGNIQPAVPGWNALGYANNAIHQVRVTVL